MVLVHAVDSELSSIDNENDKRVDRHVSVINIEKKPWNLLYILLNVCSMLMCCLCRPKNVSAILGHTESVT